MIRWNRYKSEKTGNVFSRFDWCRSSEVQNSILDHPLSDFEIHILCSVFSVHSKKYKVWSLMLFSEVDFQSPTLHVRCLFFRGLSDFRSSWFEVRCCKFQRQCSKFKVWWPLHDLRNSTLGIRCSTFVIWCLKIAVVSRCSLFEVPRATRCSISKFVDQKFFNRCSKKSMFFKVWHTCWYMQRCCK